MKLSALYVIVLVILVKADSIPELKTSLDFQQLNNLKTNILEPLVEEFLQDVEVPLDINLAKHIPILGDITLKADHIKLNYVTLNWPETRFRPLSEDTLQLQIADLSLSLEANLQSKLFKWKVLDSPTVFRVDNLDLALTIRFDASSPTTTWGFVPVITDAVFNLESVHVSIVKSWIPQEAFDDICEMIVPLINKHGAALIMKYLAPSVGTLAQKGPINLTVPLGNSHYSVEVTFTSPPRVFYENDLPYLSIAIDLGFRNLDSGSFCPHFDTGSLPDKVISSQDLELIVGGNLIDQVFWLLIDSGSLDITIDNSALADLNNLPISLTTSGLKLIIADFYNTYGADKGMYVRLYATQPVQNVYIRSGRILGALSLMAEFIVDKDSSNYPQPLEECTECVTALAAEIDLGLMATLYNLNQTTFGGQAMLVKVIELIQTGGELTSVQPAVVTTTLNSLIGGLLPSINADLAAGIANPLIGLFGISGTSLVIGDTYITVGLSLSA